MFQCGLSNEQLLQGLLRENSLQSAQLKGETESPR